MKSSLFITALLLSYLSYSQQPDYSVARVDNYILGVYVFVNCTPIYSYDYVGNVKKFEIQKTSRKDLEKIIKKARKKHPFFNGMVFKKDLNHVELIKFKDSKEAISGFKIGDRVSYSKQGVAIKGIIIAINDAKQKVVIEYLDSNGKEQLDKILLKNLSHQN